MKIKITLEEIIRAKTFDGSWTKSQLEAWGVPYPPPKGWRKCLTKGKSISSLISKNKKKARKKAKKKQEKAPKTFYQTWEWKKLRYSVIQKHGSICMCCGASKDDGVRIVVDHIKPVSKFPELKLDPNNLQVLCNDCNMGKSNVDYTDFREDPQFKEFNVSLSVLLGERMPD